MPNAALTASGLAEYCKVSISADEVEHPNPDAQLHLAAFDQLGAQPRWCPALQDSAAGVTAACASGAFLACRPNQNQFNGHLGTTTLADPQPADWAQKVTTPPVTDRR